jgi:organic radical activating enzyme
MFAAPQGEGGYTGTLMTFLRLAGCTVGKPFTKDERAQMPELKVYQEKCHTVFGNSFACDTNYRAAMKMTQDAILEHQLIRDARRVCISGGEPLMHEIYPLIRDLINMGKYVHLETSGTISFMHLLEFKPMLWITCSPKKDCLPESLKYADELKVLVDEYFNEGRFIRLFGSCLDKVWIQPINQENSLDFINVQHVLQLQERFPETRISVQLHKVLHTR